MAEADVAYEPNGVSPEALAIAASRLSFSMIGVPSAACRANSFRPGAMRGAWGKSPGTSSERICFT